MKAFFCMVLPNCFIYSCNKRIQTFPMLCSALIWRHAIFPITFRIYDVDCTVVVDLNADWMVDSCALLELVVCGRWDPMIFESRLESVEAGRKCFKLVLSRMWQFVTGHLGQMIAFSSESIFISDVAHLNKLSIWCCVRVRPLSYLRLILTASVLQVATFIGLDSVASWVAVLIAAVMRNFILVRSDWNDISIGLIGGLLGNDVLLLRFVLLLVTLMAERLRLGVVKWLLVVTVVAGHKKLFLWFKFRGEYSLALRTMHKAHLCVYQRR